MANKKQNNASENSAELEQMQKKLDELNGRMDELLKSPLLQNQEMKELMKEEVKSAKKKEKRRSAEIFAVFAAHNFYADGFTPEELRTTLEDLGPTYVKIGQIMSSRPDILPESYCKELESSVRT